MGGERGLAHAAFLVEQRDDHGLALHAGRAGFVCCVCGRAAVVHRDGVSLLQVREFKLGKLREVETRAVIGFADDPYS
ncbi:hypothetical protein G6F58_013836 [Rhizopus delemar]|nr:hypothetical protein G6F58_013836 [Rhizopus delemar]